MSVLSIVESPGSPRASESLEGGITFTRTFRVVTSDPVNDGPQTAISAAPGLLSYYQFGPETHPAHCVDRQVEREGPTVWRVECQYRYVPRQQDEEPEDPNQQPELELPEVTIGLAMGSKELTKDADGEWIVNDAGERFAQFPSRDWPSIRYTITKNYSINTNLNPLALLVLTTNDAALWGHAAGQVRFSDWSVANGLKVTPNGGAYSYWRIMMGFDAKLGPTGGGDNDWKLRILNESNTYLGTDGKRYQFKTAEGYPYKWFVDADGRPSSTPVYKEFNVYPQASWAALGLPSNLAACRPTIVRG